VVAAALKADTHYPFERAVSHGPSERPVRMGSVYRALQESPADADKPARRESMPKIAPIDVKTCCRQVNDLFEVM